MFGLGSACLVGPSTCRGAQAHGIGKPSLALPLAFSKTHAMLQAVSLLMLCSSRVFLAATLLEWLPAWPPVSPCGSRTAGGAACLAACESVFDSKAFGGAACLDPLMRAARILSVFCTIAVVTLAECRAVI